MGVKLTQLLQRKNMAAMDVIQWSGSNKRIYEIATDPDPEVDASSSHRPPYLRSILILPSRAHLFFQMVSSLQNFPLK